MNFLQLCTAVRSRIGLQGTGPTSVADTTGVHGDIVDAVYDSWLDIQNFREEWDWMKGSDTFTTTIDQSSYTKLQMGGTTNRINKIIKDSVWLNDGSQWGQMTFIDYDEFIYRYKNDSESRTPSIFTIDRSDGSLEMETPDAEYTVSFDFWKTPQVLENNTDTPELPTQFHLLIVYLAVQKLSATIASSSTGFEFAQAYAVMMGQLMRSQLEKKTIRTRGIA